MKQHITTIKNRAIDWIFKRMHIVDRTGVQEFDLSRKQLREASSSHTDILVLRKSAYVSFDKRYKVISQKELKGIVANEHDFHSPFATSYTLHKIQQIDEGNWQVTYYFVDLARFPTLSQYRLILIWDDFICHWIGEVKSPVLVDSPVAQQYVIREDGAINVSDVESNSLKQRILMASAENNPNHQVLAAEHFAEQFFHYFISFSWLSLSGSINRARWLPAKQTISLSPKQMAIAGAVLGAAVVIESAWLMGLDFYFEQQMQNTVEIREQYSTAKSAYLKRLDKYSQYADVVKQRSAASSVPQLLADYPQKSDIRIDRMDYLQGEVRLGGIAGDIEAFMNYLSEQTSVQGLAFMSPITQDKRTGKDRFSIRFDWRK